MGIEKTFVCKDCGNEFTSKANHADYCQDCRKKRQYERARAYREKKRNSEPTRALGSMDTCPECGKQYMVMSGSQKVCEDCRRKYENKRKSKTNNEYTARTYDTILVAFKKGTKIDIQQKIAEYKIATGEDMSVNEFISRAVERMLTDFDSVIKSESK